MGYIETTVFDENQEVTLNETSAGIEGPWSTMGSFRKKNDEKDKMVFHRLFLFELYKTCEDPRPHFSVMLNL